MAIPQTKSEKVLATINDLHNTGKQAHRQVIADAMGEPLSIIDDHIKVLIEAGSVKRTGPGIVAPAKRWKSDDPMSITVLEEGDVLVEKGDTKLYCTPSEWRKLGSFAIGTSLTFSLGVKG